MGFVRLALAISALVSSVASHVYALPSLLLTPRPLVIWHGLGDSYASPGILQFIQLIQDVHPGIFVHSVHIVEDNDADRKAGWVSYCLRSAEYHTHNALEQFGNVNEQVANVSLQLGSVPELQGGFDAIGFSQGKHCVNSFLNAGNNHH